LKDSKTEFSSEIDWDGMRSMSEAATDIGPVRCKVPRDTVHVTRLYGDAIGREIYLERHQIIEKLAPFLPAGQAVACRGRPDHRIASMEAED
jgi:hypothetical protein